MVARAGVRGRNVCNVAVQAGDVLLRIHSGLSGYGVGLKDVGLSGCGLGLKPYTITGVRGRDCSNVAVERLDHLLLKHLGL